MELRRLRYFIAIAEAGSMSGAATVLNIAQPALSRQLRLLEEEFGVTLFTRSRSGMKITKEGRFLQSGIVGPLRELEMAIEEAGTGSKAPKQKIVLGIPSTTIGILAQPLLKRMAKEMPRVKLIIVEGHPSHLLDLLYKSELDMTLSYGTTPNERFFDRDLLVEDLLLVGGAGSGLPETVQLSQIINFPLVLPNFDRGIRSTLEKAVVRYDHAIDMYDHAIDIAFEADSLSLIKDMVARKLAYSVLPYSAITRECERGEMEYARIVGPEIKLYLVLVCRPYNEAVRSVVRRFSAIVVEELARLVKSGDWPAQLLFDVDQMVSELA